MTNPQEAADAPPAEDKNAPWEMPEVDGSKAIEIPLMTPTKHGGQLLESITLQPLKGKHLKKLPVDSANMNVGHVMGIAAIQAQLPPSVIDELTAADLANVLGVTNAFLALIQGTGKTP